MQEIRIFISSPGDVQAERGMADQVIERLQGDYWNFVRLEAVLWEYEATRAVAHFNEEIIAPAECDIVVSFLWTRLGSRMPPQFTRADGSRFESGTEWEIVTAAEAHERTGRPDLMVYRRFDQPPPSADPARRADAVEQLAKLEHFWAGWFQNPDGTIRRAFVAYQDARELAPRLTEQLRKLIHRRLPASVPAYDVFRPEALPPGSPFRGLHAFGFEDAPLFFGRSRAVAGIARQLQAQAASENGPGPFVLILGGSGSGKSSLARAGVGARLTHPNTVSGVDVWRRTDFHPSAVPGQTPLETLAAVLAAALPELAAHSLGEHVLDAAGLVAVLADPEWFVLLDGPLHGALAAVAAVENGTTARLFLVVDQLEEIFTDKTVGDAAREAFAAALAALAGTRAVWIAATMRSEFFARAIELPPLRLLMRGEGSYTLLPPDAGEISQIVRYPAAAANLAFERHPQTGESLADAIHAEATRDARALPLLEFLLQDLYEHRDANNVLLWDRYEAVGKLAGALVSHADAALAQLREGDERRALDAIFLSLVTMDDQEQAVPTRNRAPRAALERIPGGAHALEVFIAARLFVTDAEAAVPVVSLAHEALLAHWPYLQEFVKKHAGLLRSRRRLADLCRRWQEKADHDPKGAARLLLDEGSLAEAQEVVRFGPPDLTEAERDFVHRSTAKAQSRLRRLRAAVGVFAALAVAASLAGLYAWRQQQVAAEQRTLADKNADRANEQRTLADRNAQRADQNAQRADEQRNVADKNARQVRLDAGRAQFLTGMEWLRQDESDRALAHLARALRIDPENSAAFDRLYTLLAQRSWPLPVRVIPHEFAAKGVRLLPDRRRLVTGTALDGYAARGVCSIQFWDWTRARLLALPSNAPRNDLDGLTLSADRSTLAVTRTFKGQGSEDSYRIPPPDAPPWTPGTGNPEQSICNNLELQSLSGNGQWAAVDGIGANPENSTDLTYLAVVPTGDGGAARDGAPVYYLAFGKLPADFPAASRPTTTSFTAAPFEALLGTHFDGAALLLLFRDGSLYRFEPAARRITKARALTAHKTDPAIVLAAFAERSPLVALLRDDGGLETYDWQQGRRVAEPVDPGQACPWLGRWIAGHRKAETDDSSDRSVVALRFLDNDRAVGIEEQPTADGNRIGGQAARPPHCAVWTLPADGAEPVPVAAWTESVLPAGQTLVGARRAGTRIFLHDRTGTARLCEPLRHESEAKCIDVLDEDLFASGSTNGFVRVWKRLPKWLAPPEPAESPDADKTESALLARSADGAQLFGAGSSRSYEPTFQRGETKLPLEFPRWSGIYGGNFNPAGKLLAVYGSDGLRGSTRDSSNEGVYIVDALTGKTVTPLLAHDGCVWAGFDLTGRWIVSAGNGYIQFWDAQTFAPSGPRFQHAGVAFCAWNPVRPGLMVSVAEEGGMRLWNVDQQTLQREITPPKDPYAEATEPGEEPTATDSLTFDATGSRFAVRQGDTVSLWDVETGEGLLDPVEVPSDGLALPYADAVRLLACPTFAHEDTHPAEAALLASLADAVAGFRLGVGDATETFERRGPAFIAVRDALARVPPDGPAADLARRVLGQPAVAELLQEEGNPVLDTNLGEGRAAYFLVQAAEAVTLYGDDAPRIERYTLDRYRLAEVEQEFRDARRVFPAGAERMIHALVDAWSRRPDALAALTAIHFGSREPATLERARKFLEEAKIRLKKPPESDEESSHQEQEEAVREWEKLLGS